MEHQSPESLETSQTDAQLPEVSSTPCFVILDSQADETENKSGGEGDTRLQRLRQLGELSKGLPIGVSPEIKLVKTKTSTMEEEDDDAAPQDEGRKDEEEARPSQTEIVDAGRVDVGRRDPGRAEEEEEEDEDVVSSTQDDLFVENTNPSPKMKRGENTDGSYTSAKDSSRLICTPSESISCLRLTGVYASETSTSGSGSSINVLYPSPEAYGPAPVIIPSTPSGPDTSKEEPMDLSMSEHDITTDTVVKKPALKRKSTASDNSEDVPAWQQELNQQQQMQEAEAGTSEDSWLADDHSSSKHPKSLSASVDSSNPSSSVSLTGAKSSVESSESLSLQQQQPMMTSTAESSRQSESRPPSANILQERPRGQSHSAPMERGPTMARPETSTERGDVVHSSLLKEAELQAKRAMGESLVDEVKGQHGADVKGQDTTEVRSQRNGGEIDVQSQKNDQVSRHEERRDKRESCSGLVELEDIVEDADVLRAKKVGVDTRGDVEPDLEPEIALEMGPEVGPSQDWCLQLSPSQTQTQTQRSVAHREPGTQNTVSQTILTRIGEPSQKILPDNRTYKPSPQQILTDNKTGKASELVPGEPLDKSRERRSETIVDDEESSVPGDDQDMRGDGNEKRDREKGFIRRQATPWQATHDGDEDEEEEDDDVVVIPESEEQVESGRGQDEWRDKSKRLDSDHSKEEQRNASLEEAGGAEADSVFMEGSDHWTRMRMGQLGDSDLVDNSSPIPGFHLSMPKDGALLRPLSATPSALRKKGQQRPDRTPRHSTPIADSDQPVAGANRMQGSSPTDKESPATKASNTLVVSDILDIDSTEHSEIPEFHMEKPAISSELLRETKESPSKKQTSVFSRVQEAKQATKTTKKTRTSSHHENDPFSLPRSGSFLRKRSRREQPSTSKGPTEQEEKQPSGTEQEREDAEDLADEAMEEGMAQEGHQMDNSATLPVDYQEEGDEGKDSVAHGVDDDEDVEMEEIEEEQQEDLKNGEGPREINKSADIPHVPEAVETSVEEGEMSKEKELEVVEVDESHEVKGASVDAVAKEQTRDHSTFGQKSTDDVLARKPPEDILEDEMSILAQFLHSENANSEADAVVECQENEQTRTGRSTARSSRAQQKKDTTIATDEDAMSGNMGASSQGMKEGGRRDPYEFTESQSNKTPTPMKERTRKQDVASKESLPSRNLDKDIETPAQTVTASSSRKRSNTDQSTPKSHTKGKRKRSATELEASLTNSPNVSMPVRGVGRRLPTESPVTVRKGTRTTNAGASLQKESPATARKATGRRRKRSVEEPESTEDEEAASRTRKAKGKNRLPTPASKKLQKSPASACKGRQKSPASAGKGHQKSPASAGKRHQKSPASELEARLASDHPAQGDARRQSGPSLPVPDTQQIPDQSPPARQPAPWKQVSYLKVTVVQKVKVVEEWGETVERTVLSQEVVDEVIEKLEQSFTSPSPRSKSGSLTSGYLGDVSSLGSRTSSSNAGSLVQKTSSILSTGFQKSTSLSSISEADSSLAKTISLPGSNKTSPNVSGHEQFTEGAAVIVSPGDAHQQVVSQRRVPSPRKSPQGMPSGERRRSPISPLTSVPTGRATRSSPHSVQSGGIDPGRGSPSVSGQFGTSLGGRRTSAAGESPARTAGGSSPSVSSSEGDTRRSGDNAEFIVPRRTPSRRKAAGRTPDKPSPDQNLQEQPGTSGVASDGEQDATKRVSSSDSNNQLKESPKNTPPRVSPRVSFQGLATLEHSSEESEGIPCAQPCRSNGRTSSDESLEQNKTVQSTTEEGGEAIDKDQRPQQTELDDTQVFPVEETGLPPVLVSPPREPKRSGNASSTSELTSDSAQAFLVPGVRVYTRWLDGFYYPGTIKTEEKSNRLKISFDDGDVRVVNSKDLIIKDWLSRGQSVMAESPDGYSYPGIVVGYYRGIGGAENGYVVETDNGETSRFPRSKVILSKDQAALLMTSCTSSSAAASEISLDNLVEGPRQRSRLRAPGGDGPSRTPSKVVSKAKKPASPAVTRSGGKRKLKGDRTKGDESPATTPRKKARQLMPQSLASIVASPDLGKQGIGLRRSPRKLPPPVSSPAKAPTTASPAPGPSSNPADLEALLGPLPSNQVLFKGMAFLLTQGEVRRRQKVSTDSSTSESDVEEVVVDDVPFNKDHCRRQIESGGGVILKDFQMSQRSQYNVVLIANTYCRTKKYFLALAVNMPCVSHLWVRECSRMGRLVNHKAYLLPAGESVVTNDVMEWKANRLVLSGLKVFVVSQYYEVESTWTSILMAAGCGMVKKFPTMNELSRAGIPFDCNVVVTDPTCPRHVLHRAQQLAVPVVSVEWVMQCLIQGARLPYTLHPKFDWDYKEKINK